MGVVRSFVGRLPKTRKGRTRLGVAASGAVGAIVILTAVHPWSTTSYDLHDSGVWITRQGEIGRVNGQIAEIDLAMRETSKTVLQDGRATYVVTKGDNTTISRLDPADPDGADRTKVEVSGQADVAVGGKVVAALSGGRVSIVGRGGSLDGGATDVMRLGSRGKIAVGGDGTVAGFDPAKGRLFVLAPGAEEAERSSLASVAGGFDLALIGDRPVVLDIDEERLLVADGDPVPITGQRGKGALQTTGPASDAAIVGFDGGLVSVDLDGGSVSKVPGTGTGAAVRPAVDDRCTYGAWLGKADAPGRAHVRCAGEALATTDLPNGTWQWRTGGQVIALNEPTRGFAFVLLDGELIRVGDWPEKDSSRTTATTVDLKEPNPKGKHDPVATADVGKFKVGARPGRITYLNVLRNDYDEDGDVIFVTDVGDVRGRPIARAQGGRSVSVDLTGWPQGKGGTFTFTYRISDGERTSKTVKAEIEIQTGEGSAPELIPQQSLAFSVEAGKHADYEVLSAFWDPDGDPIYLDRVTPDEVPYGHLVSWDPSGHVTFSAQAKDGAVSLELQVKDATDKAAAPAALLVDVKPAGAISLPPDLRTDFVVVRKGVPAVIQPLANDSDPNGDPIKLLDATVLRGGAPAFGKLSRDGAKIRIAPPKVGDFVLLYSASDDTPNAVVKQSTIAVRVVDPPGNAPPVGLADVVQVETGSSASVDLLRNDDDPADRMLSVTDLKLAKGQKKGAGSQLKVGVDRDYRTVHVDARTDAVPGTIVTYDYTISNGTVTSTSTVTVVVIADAGNRLPQKLPVQRIKVRAGDAALVPISAMATDADDDPLSLRVVQKPAVGEASAGGDSLRYFAPSSAKVAEARIQVEITEPTGGSLLTEVVMLITGPKGNNPPAAKDLEARVRAGRAVVIPIPTAGLDPDGDAVRLAGRSDGAALRGQLEEDPSAQTFTYIASNPLYAGIEEFTYQTVDARGLRSTPATVKIAVTRSTESHPPIAVTDQVLARPNGAIWVDPVANDTDLDGDLLALVPKSATVWTKDACTFKPEAQGLRITTTDRDCTLGYQVVDKAEDAPEGEGLSMPDLGVIQVTVVEGFKGFAPIARDDYPEVGRKDKVSVPVLANDEDPDGSPADLRITSFDRTGGVTLDPKDSSLSIPLGDTARMVRYKIRDADRHTAEAVVRVPGKAENREPVMAEIPPFTVKADAPKPLAINLAKFIKDPDEGDRLTFSNALGPDADASVLNSRIGEGWIVFAPSSKDFAGRTSVSVTATDDAKKPLSKVFSIQFIVTPRTNRPPTWVGGDPCSEVARGSGATGKAPSVTINLRKNVDDLDVAQLPDLKFSGSASKSGVRIEVSPQGSMVVSASNQATVGSTVGFTLTVDDGEPNGKTPTSCTFAITKFPGAPLLAAKSSEKVKQGETRRVDVTKLVANAEGKVTVTDAVLETGTGSGSLTKSGASFSYTPNKDFSGPVTIRYTVADEYDQKGDERKSSAIVAVQVVGRPSKPTGVSASSPESKTVKVTWNTVEPNGEPVTSYSVKAVGGGASKVCSAGSACVLTGADGIHNAKDYTFTVTAKNAVGESDVSDPSPVPVTPDRKPDPPINVVATPIPGGTTDPVASVRVTWDPPKGAAEGEFSAIKSYVVHGPGGDSAPSPDNQAVLTASTTEDACFTVTSTNTTGDSGPSEKACARPFGKPTIDTFEVRPTGKGAGTAKFTMSGNGRDIVKWELSGCGFRSENGPATEVSVNLENCSSKETSPMELTVYNAGGPGPQLSTSQTKTVTFYAPPVITGTTEVASGVGTVTITRLPSVQQSKTPPRYWRAKVVQTNAVIDDVGAGTEISVDGWDAVQIQVQACNNPPDEAESCSDYGGTSDAVAPSGPIASPTVSAVRQTPASPDVDVTITWSPPTNNTTFFYEVTGGASGSDDWSGNSMSFSFTDLTPADSSVSVRICDQRQPDNCSQWVQAPYGAYIVDIPQ